MRACYCAKKAEFIQINITDDIYKQRRTSKKMTRQHVVTVVAFLSISNVFFSSSAFAYVDPGSGSVIVTTILGVIAAISYTFRKFFYDLRAKIFGKKKRQDDRSLDD